METVFKDCVGFAGYRVSTEGLVVSVDRVVKYKRCGKIVSSLKKGMALAANTDKDGYRIVTLSVNGITKTVKVHRLVITAFRGVDNDRPHVNHINHDRSDNRLQNLEWVTPAENTQHSIRHGRQRKQTKKLTNALEQSLIRDMQQGMSNSKAAEKYKISTSLVSLYTSRKNIVVHRSKIPLNTYCKLIDDIKAGNIPRKDIATKYNVSRSYISRLAKRLGCRKLVNQHC